MIKRIPCKVISSTALSRTDSVLRYPDRSNNNRCKIGDVVTAYVRPRRPGNSAQNPKAHKLASGTPIYTGWMDITGAPIDNNPTGWLLDFYA